jgi:outer membrane protein insertion porin family
MLVRSCTSRGSIPIALGKAVVRQLTTACGKSRLVCLRRCFEVWLVALLISAAGLLALPAAARQNEAASRQPGQNAAVIERIDFAGNRRIRTDVLRVRIFSRPGDVYSPSAIDRDYHSLWNTGYFDDVYVTVEDSTDNPNGKIVTFHLKERPTIRRIEYKGNKSITESDILDAFKDRKVGLTQDSQFDPTKVKKAEVVIRDLLADHGRQFATVKATYQPIPATNSVILTFNIEEGVKVKVGKITIVGNHAFSSRRIIRAMKHSRPYGFDAKYFAVNVMAKTFDQAKLDEDMGAGIQQDLYQKNGYFEVNVKDPALVKTVDVDHHGLIKADIPVIGTTHGKSANITIEIVEGDQFRMGKLFIVNADPEKGLQLKHDFLVSVFPLKQGEILDTDKIRKAVTNYTKLYGQFGFMDFTAVPEFDIDHKNKVVNVTLRFSELKPYYIHRINISGNTTTRDKVIRRELLLDEGDLYNDRLWEYSILRLNQLGFFDQLKPETAAAVERNVKAGTVDLNLKVKEKQKQSISLTGGISGIAGTSLGLSYATHNFLGLGETLTLSSQFGTVLRSYQLGFTEPYIFDRPIATGFTIFSSKYDFDQARQTGILLGEKITLSPDVAENYNQNSKGATTFASIPIKRFSKRGVTRLALSYGFTDTNIEPFTPAATLLFTTLNYQSVAGPSALDGIHQSRVTSILSYNSVDNPINPHTGRSLTYSLSVEGGPFGGNTKAINNVFSATYFHPTYHKRNVIGIHFLGQYATSFSGSELPPFERFYAGGETDLRGFDIQTVSPIAFIPVASSETLYYASPIHLGSSGTPTLIPVTIPTLGYTISFPGGDTKGILNAEYRIPLYGDKFGMSFFLDAGSVGALRRDELNLNPAGVTSLQQAFPTSQINPELELAQRSNFRPRSSAGIEFVVQLPIIQAPFRIYWAYNYLRYNQFIVAPPGDFYISDELRNSLPPGVLQDQILPQITKAVANPSQFSYIDPLTTLRFTVSRTF